ncbi:MAG: hypothetical protein KGO85_11200, partial [Proteobacteria bacterium]|nr:hypothetical protein [Pseudomonadota bacterium]
VVALPGARWLTQWQWDALSGPRYSQLMALLASLRGRLQPISLPHLGFVVQSAFPDVLRTVQSASAHTIAYNGFAIAAGDRIGCENDEVKIVVAATATSLTIEPAFRVLPSVGSSVTLRAYSRMRLDHDGLATQVSPGGIYALSASFSEVL